MRISVLILCLLASPVLAEVRGAVTAGKLTVPLKDAWIIDSSPTFVRIIAVPYAAPDRKLVKGQPHVEVTVWCKGQFTQANLNMGRVDVYESNDVAVKYSWTNPAATRGVFSQVQRQGGLVNLSTRMAGAKPETGDVSGSWDLHFTSLK